MNDFTQINVKRETHTLIKSHAKRRGMTMAAFVERMVLALEHSGRYAREIREDAPQSTIMPDRYEDTSPVEIVDPEPKKRAPARNKKLSGDDALTSNVAHPEPAW